MSLQSCARARRLRRGPPGGIDVEKSPCSEPHGRNREPFDGRGDELSEMMPPRTRAPTG